MVRYLKLIITVILVVIVTIAMAYWQGLTSFVFAWALNFVLMTAVLYLIETFRPALNSSYYHSKKWESKGQLYSSFGVNIFRRLLVLVGWEKLNKAKNPVNKHISALEMLEYRTRQSEFGHSIIFLIVLIPTIVVIIKFGFKESIWLFVLNILLNIYPILVQRYNRPRIRRLINIKNS